MQKEDLILAKLGRARRKPIEVSKENLVRAECFQPNASLPLVMQPLVNGIDPAAWATTNRSSIEQQLAVHGGVLFRNFNITSVELFRQFIAAIAGKEPLAYSERSSPRVAVGDNIYTSTDYPANQSIFLHNENSYQQSWPMYIFFYCATPASEGGETPIADCRKIYERISPRVRQLFIDRKWMYVRNFGDGFGLPWQTVFQTNDPGVVERHCRANGIQVEWRSGDRLRVRAIRNAVTAHPRTGEPVWFNHATFFHVTTLEPSVREALLADYEGDNLPTNTFYGDGSPIEPEVLDELREAYRSETVAFPWQVNDVLWLDNMLTAHGRAPYTGERKVLVGMAHQYSRAEN
ncbi:MAG TPA: TauD/TfdA family dioxygenase [Pyrinomonadaceae bacterium]|nr:TauD/TfdA family dioxygenase [Pyrinomonadaceae bacterium]